MSKTIIIEDFKAILVECSIFFLQPSAGLTNRPQVRDSDPGFRNPLGKYGHAIAVFQIMVQIVTQMSNLNT